MMLRLTAVGVLVELWQKAVSIFFPPFFVDLFGQLINIFWGGLAFGNNFLVTKVIYFKITH
jgi:hypothetical protein